MRSDGKSTALTANNLRELINQFRVGMPYAQLARLSEQTPINTAVTLSLVVSISIFVLAQVWQPWMLVWALAQAGLILSIYIRWRKSLRHGASVSDTYKGLTRSGLFRAVIWAALSGFLWGSLTTFLPGAPPHIQIALILTMGGMAAGASTTLAAVPQVAIVYILGCCLPVTVYHLTLGSREGLLLALVFAIFLAAMLGTSHVVYTALMRQMRAEQYARQLQDAGLQQRVATKVNEAASVDNALRSCLDEVCVYTGWPAGHIYVLAGNSSNELRSSGIWYVESENRFKQLRQLREAAGSAAGEGLPGRILERDSPVWIAADETPQAEAIRDAGIKAIFGVPVSVGLETVAVLEFFSEQTIQSSNHLTELLAAIALQLGHAIERRQAEDSVRREKARLAAILGLAMNAVVCVDEKQHITVFNDNAEAVFGYSASEVLGKHVELLLPENVRPDHRKHVAAFAQQDTQLQMRLTSSKIMGLRKDGDTFPAAVSISRIEVNGEIILTVTVDDLTEKRRADEKLQQVQKMQAVGQLTSGIAHDFNNVLAVVMGNLELAEHAEKDGEGVAEYLSAAMQGAQKGADLNRRLLTFSRQEVVQERITDIGDIVRGMSDLLIRSLGADIDIETVFRTQDCTSNLDPRQLESAILNLAINARDAMPKGGTLCIEVAAGGFPGERSIDSDANEQLVRISVSDTGSGMTEDIKGRAFEPFYTTKKPGNGTGLGLSMVHAFVTQAGGEMEIDSELGKGTTVHAIFPRASAVNESPYASEGNEIPSAVDEEVVLVVEDQREVRAVVVTYLDSLGYQVLEAGDGNSGIKVLESASSVDLILSDLVLPGGMRGEEVVARARHLRPKLKCLYMSGNPLRSGNSPGSGEMEISMLQKPFSKADLARAVRGCLDNK